METSLLAAAIAMQSVELVRGVREAQPPASYAVQAMFAPYRCGDGEWVVIAVVNDEQWRRLCEVLGLAERIEGDRAEQRRERPHVLELLGVELVQRNAARQ